MANTFKKMVKKHKKKKLMAERNKQAKEQGMSGDEFVDDYERRLFRHKRNIVKRTVAAVVTIAVAVTAVGFYIEKRSYHSYKVVQSSEQEDVVSTNYVEMDGEGSFDQAEICQQICELGERLEEVDRREEGVQGLEYHREGARQGGPLPKMGR